MLSEETMERLEELGFKANVILIEIEEARPDNVEIRKNGNGAFIWDLEIPCSREYGFHERSLFLYLNNCWETREYLAMHPEMLPDASEAREISQELNAALRVSINLDASEEILREVFTGILDGVNNEDAARDWLDSMLTNSTGSGKHAREWLSGSNLETLSRVLSSSLGRLGKAIEEDADISRLLEPAALGMRLWIEEYDKNFGGELLFVQAVKKDLEEKYGAPEPMEATGFYYPKYSGDRAMIDENPDENCDAIFLRHAKDPALPLASQLQTYADAINGEGGYIEIEKNGEIVFSRQFGENDFPDGLVNDWLDEQEQKIRM